MERENNHYSEEAELARLKAHLDSFFSQSQSREMKEMELARLEAIFRHQTAFLNLIQEYRDKLSSDSDPDASSGKPGGSGLHFERTVRPTEPAFVQQDVERDKKRYAELEQQLIDRDNREQTLENEGFRVERMVEELSALEKAILSFIEQIRELRKILMTLGFFQGKNRKELSNQIEELENAKNLALDQLENSYQINGLEQIPEKLQELQISLNQINYQRAILPARQEFLNEQQNIFDKYQAINHEPSPKHQEKQPQKNLSDQLAEIAAKKRLENMTRENSQGGERSRETVSDRQNQAIPKTEKNEPTQKRSHGYSR